ncbi:MAG: DUF58 domain-containing protein [Planctomycetes bacterium]|nr:DUF58 domain-containing protein [Planctomycetota bacterium]
MAKSPVPVHPLIVVFVLLSLLVPTAIRQGNNLSIWLLGTMLIATIMTYVWTRLTIRRITIDRVHTSQARVGQPFTVGYGVQNTARFQPAFSLWIQELDTQHKWSDQFRNATAWVMEVGPNERVRTDTIFWPTKRGVAKFDQIRVRTSFPFGMIHASKVIHQPWQVLVQPELHQLQPNVLRSIVSDGPMGQKSMRRGRGGEEFYGIREFHNSDSLGDVAWKASSRRESLVCIERSRPSPPRLRVILDLTTETDKLQCEGDARSTEEKSISLAASLLAEALRQGHEFALTVFGVPTQRDVGLRSGPRHLDRLLGVLARIELDQKRVSASHSLLRDSERVGRVVIRPDHSQKLGLSGNTWFFTGSQFEDLKMFPSKVAT